MKGGIDSVVVGGGAVGLLTALALSDRGQRVTVLDAGAPPASWAGGGILSALFPWRYPDALTRLTQQALARYQQTGRRIVEAGGADPEARETGLLVQAGEECDDALAWARRWRIAAISGAEDAVPVALRDAAAVWFPEIGTLRNPRLLKGLRRLLWRCGVTQEQQIRVTSVQPVQEGWRLETSQGERVAGQVLMAAGAWSAPLLDDVGIALPVRPVQGEMLLYGANCAAPPGVILGEGGYVIPRADGQMLVGSTLCDRGYDQRPTGPAYQRLLKRAARLWPPLATQRPLAHWAGLRPGSPRDYPFLGEAPGCPGLFIATGHYRNGLVCAPASAEIMAALIMGETPAIDPAPYSLSPSSSSPP